jgi:hypothetical protein
MSGSQAVADRIHLIHVTHGRLGRPTVADLVGAGEIPTSEESQGYCGPGTRFVEEQVGYPPSVYFYAGRACPGYGQVALAFAPACEQGRVHSATPFGTGGLIKQDLSSAFHLKLQPDGLEQRVAYCKTSTVEAKQEPGWRAVFGRWLAAYYPTDPGGYWSRAPETGDPEGLYQLNDGQWQAWSWEIRFSKGPSVLDADRWAADSACLSELRQNLARLDLTPDEADRLTGFVGRLETPTGTPTFCEELERWAREQCLSKS